MLIDNTKIKLGGVDNTPEIWINGTLAIKMGWLTETGELGHNLSREYIDDKVPDLTTSDKYRDLLDKDGNGVFWAIEKNCLRLSMSCNWRFTNLNHAFRMVVGEPSRTLHVYCNVAQSTIVGGMKTDLLSEVWYERRGRGVVYFEPKHKQFHPLRQNTYETLQVDVAETNGAPAVAEGLQSLAQGKALDAAAGTVLRAGVSGLKRKASQSVRSTMQKSAKSAKNSIKSKVRQTTNHVRDVLGV